MFIIIYIVSRRTKMKDFTQTGRSMVEILGVLAIIGVLSVGALTGYSAAMEKNKVNAIVDEMSHIVANIHSIYPHSNYKNISLIDLVKLNAIPFNGDSSKVYANNLVNRLGGKLMLVAAYAPEAELDNKYNDYTKFGTFNIIYTGLSDSLCQKIATYDWTDSNLIGMMVSADTRTTTSIVDTCLKSSPVDKNGKLKDEVLCFSVNHETNGIPITPQKAAAACASCKGNSNCFIAWKYR